MEKVSVIVPVYNVKDYLEKCFDSLIRQTYKNMEIILVDDCSTDGSGELAKRLAECDPRCVFIERKENGGLSAARNTGIDAAKGEWITFVDSDDWVTEDYVAAMYDVAKKDNADIVMSSVYYFFPDGRCFESSPFADLTTESPQREKVALSGPYAVSRLWKHSFLKESGLVFPTNVWRAAEQGITIPLLTRTEKISILRKPMYYYFQRKSSNSNNFQKNVDVSFFPRSVENVIQYSAPGFEEELEYRALCDILYGMVMIMVRSGRTRREISDQVDLFCRQFPNWKKNRYWKRLVLGKRIFISCAAHKWVGVLKLLIWLWDKKQRF